MIALILSYSVPGPFNLHQFVKELKEIAEKSETCRGFFQAKALSLFPDSGKLIKNCPYCRQALKDLDALLADPRYQNLRITKIDEGENPELADQYDYYYVPTFYLGAQKKLEGALTRAQIQALLDEAAAG